MVSGGHHVARSRYMLGWWDYGVEAVSISSSLRSFTCLGGGSQQQAARPLCGDLRAVSWSHPGDGSK